MGTPVDSLPTADRFLQTLAQSGLIGREQLRPIVEQATVPIRRDAKKLADFLVEKEHLTHFQAAKLLQGTWQGLVLGPYQVLAPLGRGGMGSVFLARNVEFDARNGKAGGSALVALKVLPPKRAKNEERTLARFRREMEMCRRVSHPHLTQTFDAGEIQGVYFIAMEYIRGVSLSQFVKTNGPLLVPRAARLFAEVAAGIAHAHEKGLIHRDLKPSNIMVTPNGHAKVLDLGLAIVVDEELPLDKKIVGGQGYVLGTMDYIAPEQVEDPTGIDARADLYSLGCSIYFAVTGQTPFPGGTSIEKMKRHRSEFAEPLSELNPTIPVAFSRIVEKLMEKNPDKRYRSAVQIREALLPWAEGDLERPLDVDPFLTEAEALHQLESELGGEPELWWESVPVISFDATAKHSTAVAATSRLKNDPEEPADPKERSSTGQPHPLLVAGFAIMGVIALVLLLELTRR